MPVMEMDGWGFIQRETSGQGNHIRHERLPLVLPTPMFARQCVYTRIKAIQLVRVIQHMTRKSKGGCCVQMLARRVGLPVGANSGNLNLGRRGSGVETRCKWNCRNGGRLVIRLPIQKGPCCSQWSGRAPDQFRRSGYRARSRHRGFQRFLRVVGQTVMSEQGRQRSVYLLPHFRIYGTPGVYLIASG
ncbi:hypothetical protein N658DRAFT_321405 [Parathielavia hyrcaniae]|uniref:Uncharacterized protein n=1 Tax=Parathielavia hyrcaniae TaxID=113614 RepID=A0AAN6T3H4_9PEZI|nr:hypothetical protein N658DRAFT_321405 [Parathielavia hyrcaniae]